MSKVKQGSRKQVQCGKNYKQCNALGGNKFDLVGLYSYTGFESLLKENSATYLHVYVMFYVTLYPSQFPPLTLELTNNLCSIRTCALYRDGYRDQIVTYAVGVSLHSKTHRLFI